ncbi:MAG: hypothetical protein VX589_16745 [Myxococcota bacterium]|nr:hypothetical protein [Myxococcota bacterium]
MSGCERALDIARWACLLVIIASPSWVGGTATPVRLCVLSAAVNPVKPDGRPWDGPSWGKDEQRARSGRDIISELVAKSAAMLIDLDPAIALTTMVAKVGLQSYAVGTKAPDLKVRVTLGEELLIQTDAVQDSIAPSFAADHQHCSKPVRRRELAQEGVRIVIVDQDLSNDDMVGSAFKPKGFSVEEIQARIIQVSRPDFVVRLGMIDAHSAIHHTWREVARQRVVIDAGDVWQKPVKIVEPTRLMVEWSSVGVSTGLKKAMNDDVVAAWLADPSGRDVPGSRQQGKKIGQWVGIVREPGTYRLHISNRSLTRITPRRVQVSIKRRPVN